ncbi:MAG: hypothetical protein LBI10_03265 [Deltaproteobacteria bacterium]|nr:hypothetical protein [Deltaproteobacteria bacterium]
MTRFAVALQSLSFVLTLNVTNLVSQGLATYPSDAITGRPDILYVIVDAAAKLSPLPRLALLQFQFEAGKYRTDPPTRHQRRLRRSRYRKITAC